MLEKEVQLFKRNSHCDECNYPYTIVGIVRKIYLKKIGCIYVTIVFD